MNPTPADDWLDTEIPDIYNLLEDNLLQYIDGSSSLFGEEIHDKLDYLTQRLTAHLKAAEVAARISELENLEKYTGAWFKGDERLVNWINLEVVTDRIATLKAESEQV